MNQQLKNTIDAINRASSDREREALQQLLHEQVERVKRFEKPSNNQSQNQSWFKRWLSRLWN